MRRIPPATDLRVMFPWLPRARAKTGSFLSRVLLGMPTKPFTGGTQLAGRAQAPWGAWWAAHPRMLRGLSLIALAWMAAYLTWRIGWSWRGAALWLWIPLLITEVYGFWNLAFLTWFGWDIREVTRPEREVDHKVDVYVCTYDENAAVLRATLAGCAAMTYPHTTYLLDDGRRPEMAKLAEQWGAQYVTRPDNSHAKAGNINHALPITGGDLVFVLDADHVPLPDALDAVVGYFDDGDCALVQTPHDFYNHDSIQHYEVGRHEQSVFYSTILPGKDRHGASFWCGSGAVIRRGALLDVGGVATETIAEDFHTTIKLHQAGWTSRYHDEVIIQGLAPHDLAAYLLQRDRWARGNLAVFTTKQSPFRARTLSKRQRLSYLGSLSAYLAGPMRLLLLGTLIGVLWTGELPLSSSLLTLAIFWFPAVVLGVMSGSALCRGYQRISDTTHFELCTAEIFLRALRCAIVPGRTTFKVTPKEGVDHGGLDSLRQLKVVNVLALLLLVGLVLQLLNMAGVHLLTPTLHGLAFWLVPAVALVELRRVLRTLALVARRRQQRIEYRMPLTATATVTSADGVSLAEARDLSPSGLRLALEHPLAVGTYIAAGLELPGIDGEEGTICFDLIVRACHKAGNGWVVGASIVHNSHDVQRRIVEYCYVVSSVRRLRPVEAPATLPVPAEHDEALLAA
jgi:cellulose synthase (UDP-forming)